MRPTIQLACAIVLSLAAGSVAAQTQVKPYFLVVFDTSGSMEGGTPAPSCPGYPANKLGTAKCVLSEILNATGDADFGLMQFAQTGCGSGATGGGSCTPDAASAWLRVPIESNSITAITRLLDNAGAAPADELCHGGYTPLGGTLIAAKQYFEGTLNYDTSTPAADPAPTTADPGFTLGCRPLAVILMTDGEECCANCMDSWSGCPNAMANNPGITCATTCQNTDTCGGSDGFESAPEHAYQLLTGFNPANGDLRGGTAVPTASGAMRKPIQTYVIGFGITDPNQRIENIAIAGGTSSAFYADNEAELSAAFNQIIADAQPPAEVCNNLDDDCDTLIDEGIPKYCDKPGGIDMPELCDEPDETLCDGEDDDCDGLIDEGTLNACGLCGEVPPEVCDGQDNDCDSRIDEMTDGGECGTDVGRCEKGELRCIGGVEQCRGEVGPRDEICNCEDDDCDGNVDEDITGDLCPDGKCIACECVPRCESTFEFMPVCEDGRRPEVEDSGECFCIIDNCDAVDCMQDTLEREDEVACAPDDPAVAPCSCRAGMCAARCDGVTCRTGDTCNRRTGRCVEDNCRGLGCPASGELCDPLSTECVADPCAEVSCESDEQCRDGECRPSCAGIVCDEDERCRGGSCVTDLCLGVECDDGFLCDGRNGECVEDPCEDGCDDGLVCSVASGECERGPCWNVHCPTGQVCDDGECIRRASGGMRPPVDDDPNADAERILAAGGGGCSCQTAGARPISEDPSSRHGLWALVVLAGALLLRARRRRSGGALFAAGCAVAALLLASTGCRVTPFCVDCVDAGSRAGRGGDGAGGRDPGEDAGPGEDGGRSDGGTDVDGGNGDAGDDAGPPRCTQPEPESCDGRDQDCDFKVDEDVVAEDNDCIQFGLCAGTRPTCVDGEFVCVYPDAREDDETLCDAIDNDCDNRVDEAHPALGASCEVGVGACKAQGEQVCSDDGLTLRCDGEPLEPGDEVCDGIDNDCDALVDEPRSAPGDNPSFVVDDVVAISASLFIQRYEASRPDATETARGVIGSRACSRAGVLPWTNLTYQEAVDACAAADMRLCTDGEWLAICDGPANNCLWSYTPTGGSCPTTAGGYPSNASPAMKQACNGHDLTATAGSPDVDALAATGSYPRCFVAFGAESVFDLSGNAKEWTAGGSASARPLRGGSYNNLPGGMQCNFDFAVAAETVRLRNVGFRCCSDSDPTVAP